MQKHAASLLPALLESLESLESLEALEALEALESLESLESLEDSVKKNAERLQKQESAFDACWKSL